MKRIATFLLCLSISTVFTKSELLDNTLCGVHPQYCENSDYYRTFDGSCNNLKHPYWGTTNSVYSRMLPAVYEDGVSEPSEIGVNGVPKPLVRDVSTNIFPDKLQENPMWTLGFVQFGQFIAHDIVLGKGTEGPGDCCIDNKKMPDPANLPNPRCYPFKIPKHDIQYIVEKKECVSMLKTFTDHEFGCYKGYGPVYPINSVNSYLDLSHIYGNDKSTADSLRLFSDGYLYMEEKHNNYWLPNTGKNCLLKNPYEPCYRAGDVRVNQNAGLTVLQTIWAREHNRICDELASLNPHWDDEKLYQEARKINIAQYQHIIYTEFLPILLGKEIVHKHNITFNSKGFVDNYDEFVSPSVTLEFAVGAYRHFHSAVAGIIQLINEKRHVVNTTKLSIWNQRPTIVEDKNGEQFDNLARGLTTQKHMAFDRFITTELTQFFSTIRNNTIFGYDLQSFQIQRDREHGLQSYNDYRAFFGLPKAKCFDDLTDTINEDLVNILRKLYDDVNDIDFSVGGFLEEKYENSLTGYIFTQIITDQFKRLRFGDRFFYERPNNSFTLEQLNQIRKVTFSRIICDNGNSITHMQSSGFDIISDKNALKLCSVLPAVNLSLWLDQTKPGGNKPKHGVNNNKPNIKPFPGFSRSYIKCPFL